MVWHVGSFVKLQSSSASQSWRKWGSEVAPDVQIECKVLDRESEYSFLSMISLSGTENERSTKRSTRHLYVNSWSRHSVHQRWSFRLSYDNSNWTGYLCAGPQRHIRPFSTGLDYFHRRESYGKHRDVQPKRGDEQTFQPWLNERVERKEALIA